MKKSDIIKVIVASLLVIIICTALAFMIGSSVGKKKAKETFVIPTTEAPTTEAPIITPEITIDKQTVEEIIAPAGELVSYKYYYTDAGSYKKSQTITDTDFVIPFTTDETVYTFSGTIGAGIDLNDVDFDVDNDRKVITVYLPEPKVLSNEIDEKSFQTYDVRRSIFTSSDLKDYTQFIGELKASEEDKLNSNREFWDQLRKNTEKTISGLMSANDQLDEYVIKYEWNETSK
ncbi:MAG: DUF4230 domain-containing protein [Eubacterium sp.]|nr:DUF4230 domain-containing protein [Eubacterium sp.]